MSHVLTIRKRNGSCAGRSSARSVHAARDEAEAALLDYVQPNGDAEMGTNPLDSPEGAVEEYFAEALEAYEIRESA